MDCNPSWKEMALDEKVEAIKKYKDDGLSASQIASRFDGCSRSAVLGVVYRNISGESDFPTGEAPAITVEKNIPLPRLGSPKYPFRSMEVGDSFLVPRGAPVNRIRKACSDDSTRNGRKYSVRKTADGLRVWRIA